MEMEKELFEQLNEIPVPKEVLQQVRMRALYQKKREEKRRKNTIKTMISVAVILLSFITSIRLSPTVASAVAKIPGLEPLVAMIAHDKGIEDILGNDYTEQVNKTVIQDNMSLTVEQVIADESGMVIAYKLEGPLTETLLKASQFEIYQHGEQVQASVTYSLFTTEPTDVYENVIQIAASTGMDYTHRDFELRLMTKDVNIIVPFILEQDIVKTKNYTVNEQVEIDGQKITVKSMHISPLSVEVIMAVDSTNTKRILKIGSLQLLDENGEVWSGISNGISGFGTEMDEEFSYFLQSNYFREPKALTLKISEIEALMRGEDYIEVDFDQGKSVYVPELPYFEITEIYPQAVYVKYKPDKPEHHRQVFSYAVDAVGNELESKGSTFGGGEEFHESSVRYKIEGIVNPVKIYFYSFPQFLEGSASVEIPLVK